MTFHVSGKRVQESSRTKIWENAGMNVHKKICSLYFNNTLQNYDVFVEELFVSFLGIAVAS